MRSGSGLIEINGKALDDYFGRQTSRMIVRQPLDLVGMAEKIDLVITVEEEVHLAKLVPSGTVSPAH